MKKQKLHQQTFHTSMANILRSIATYYTSGVMGKRKYQAVRVASSMTSCAKKRGGGNSYNFYAKLPNPKVAYI